VSVASGRHGSNDAMREKEREKTKECVVMRVNRYVCVCACVQDGGPRRRCADARSSPTSGERQRERRVQREREENGKASRVECLTDYLRLFVVDKYVFLFEAL